MSMTSFRNSEDVWEENKSDKVLFQAAGFIRYLDSLVYDFNYSNWITPKHCYKRMVYYSKYYTENADPISEVAKRGMLFE